MSQFQNILCPQCAARLSVEARSLRGVVLCAHCGGQFRQGEPWPVVRTSGKAVASLILGIGAIGGLCFTGVPALILGCWALGEMRQPREGVTLTGKRWAITGATLGGMMSLIACLLPLALLAFVPPQDQAMPRQESAAAGVEQGRDVDAEASK